MRILKQGAKNLKLVGECAVCGCEFVLDDEDKYEERRDGSNFYKCPNCGRNTMLAYEPVKELTIEEFLKEYTKFDSVSYDPFRDEFECVRFITHEYRTICGDKAHELYDEYLKTHKIPDMESKDE